MKGGDERERERENERKRKREKERARETEERARVGVTPSERERGCVRLRLSPPSVGIDATGWSPCIPEHSTEPQSIKPFSLRHSLSQSLSSVLH